MKRAEVIRRTKKAGWWLLREGGKHSMYTNGTDTVAIPRHNEINEYTAKGILRKVESK